MNRVVFLLALAVMLGGCARNGFTTFYTGQAFKQVQASGVMETCQSPEVRALPLRSPQDIGNMMYSNGFVPIGTSAWEGPASEGDAEALIQGKKVGACLVLWKADYSHTRQGSMPMSVYTPGGTSTTMHSGTVYSGGASGMYSGTSTTYNQGTVSTQYIPYSVNRYDYLAVYFVRIVNDPQALMIKVSSLTDAYMRATDSRNGGLVTAVMKDGNAYKANIFPGDVIMSINDEAYTPLAFLTPGSNELKIWRDGKIITKIVTTPIE